MKLVNIVTWLNALGMSRYVATFQENEIDSDVLPTLTAEDLKDLGVTIVGHRRKILNSIQSLSRDDHGYTTAQDDLEEPSRSAERRQLTVLFCDLVGSTELSAKLDPEDLADVIRAYQEVCANCIDRWGGHVAKYLGDGVLAYFGYPTAHEDDAERSVRAGLDMAAVVGNITTPDGHPLAARIGIATGLVVVGELIGEGSAQEEAVVGETPNLAARLEAIASPGSVAISPQTRQLLGKLFSFENLGEHALKGFDKPIAVSAVKGVETSVSRFEGRAGNSLTPLVGRDHEMLLLHDLWQRAADGEGQMALIAGEAGIGKSRILEAIKRSLKNQPHTRVLFQCSPFHTSSALHPVIEQLEQAAEFERTDSEENRLDKLESLLTKSGASSNDSLPLIAALLSLPTERYVMPTLSPQRQKERTLDVLIGQLQGLSQQQPVLLLFEDLHWIDPTSLELLDELADQIDGLPILAIFTYRPEFQPGWLGKSNVHGLLLNRLAKRQCAAMIDKVAKGRSISDQVVNEIIVKTDGVPLFVEELTKTILSTGFSDKVAKRGDAPGISPSRSIPETLQDSLTARLDRLPRGREMAQLGAVIGREFTYEMISGISVVDDEALLEDLECLVSAELLQQYGHPPLSRYTFKHALIRDSAYQSLLKRTRHQCHKRLAEVMVARFPEIADTQPELVAHHFTEACCPEKAVTFWLKAGSVAASKSANIEAVDHYQQGLQVVSTIADPDERALRELDLQVGLGSSLVATKYINHIDVGRAYTRAWELCQQVEDYSRGFLALRGQQLHLMGRGEFKKSQAFAEEALRVAEKLDHAAYRVGAHMAVGVTLFYQGQLKEALPQFQRGSEIYDLKEQTFSDWPGSQPGVQCQFWPILISWMLGYPNRALAERDNALSSAEAAGHPLTSAQTLCTSSLLHILRREPLEARDYVKQALEICVEHRISHWNAFAMVLHGWVLCVSGESNKGLAEIELGVKSYGLGGNQHILLTLRASAELQAGLSERALLSAETGLKVVKKMGGAPFEAELHQLRGKILANNPNGIRKGETTLRKGIEVAQHQSAKSWELRNAITLARLWQQQGKGKKAIELLEPLVDWFDESPETADLLEAKSTIEEIKKR